MAAKRGHKESVEMLLRLGADPKIYDQNGFTTLHLAAYLGNNSIVRELVMGTHTTLTSMDPTCTDGKHQLTPLHIAAYRGHVDVCRYLANEMRGPGKKGVDIWPGKGTELPQSPNKRASFSSLMHRGINMAKSGSNTSRHGNGSDTKILKGNRGFSPYVLNLNDPNGAGLENGNGPDVPLTPGSLVGSASPGSAIGTDFGNSTQPISTLKHYSPLAVAVKGHQSKVCRVLIEADANPNLEDGSGKKPYDRALRIHSKLSERVTLLSGVGDRSGGNDSYFCREPECWMTLKRLFFDVGRKDLEQSKKTKHISDNEGLEGEFSGGCFKHATRLFCSCCVQDVEEKEPDYFPIAKKKTFRRSSVVVVNDASLLTRFAETNESLNPREGSDDSNGGGSGETKSAPRSCSPGLSGGVNAQPSMLGKLHLAKRNLRNTPGLAGAASFVSMPSTPSHGPAYTPANADTHALGPQNSGRNKPRRRASFLGAFGLTGADKVQRLGSGIDGMRSRGKAMSAAKHVCTKSFSVVSELEKSRLVQDRTSSFASRHFLKNGTFFLLIIVLFFQFTPASFDFPTRHIYQLNSFLETTIFESASLIDSRDAWFHWHQTILLGGAPPSTVLGQAAFKTESEFGQGNGIVGLSSDGQSNTPGNVAYLLDENMIQGPMSITSVQAEVIDCQFPLETDPDPSTGSSPFSNVKCYNGRTADSIPDGRQSLEGYDTDPLDVSTGAGHTIWMGGNLSTAWQQLEDLRTRTISVIENGITYAKPWPFINASTRLVTTNLNAYNPDLKLYVAVLVETQFLSTGAVIVMVNVESAHLNSGRFPPSVEFEAVLSALAIVMLLNRLLDARSSRSCSAVTDNRVELMTWAFMVAIIVYDATVRFQVEALNLHLVSPWSTEYLNLRPTMESLRNLLTFLSVVAMMIWSPMIQELMLFPKMGPMIVAIFETIFSRDVKLYLVLFAMFFMVSFVTLVTFGLFICGLA